MKNLKKISVLWVVLCIAVGISLSRFWAQVVPECNESIMTFADSFDTTDWKDPASSASWEGRGEVTLSLLGANFQLLEPAGMGTQITVSDSGDFDGDGYPDLIALDVSAPSDRKLVLLRNRFNDANGDGVDDDGIILLADVGEYYDQALDSGPSSITVADFNKDGLLDFFFYKNATDSFSYNQFVAAMYINAGTATDPEFSPHQSSPNLDFSGAFMSAGIYCNWTANHLCSVDIDKDDDVDLLVTSQDKIFLVRNPGSGSFDVAQFEITELNYDQKTGFTTGVGGSSIGAGDFDRDGDVDMICGTAEPVNYLAYYENNGMEFFTRRDFVIPYPEATGTVGTIVEDLNNDGYPDIFGATDKWRTGNDSRIWWMKNLGTGSGQVEFEFRCLNNCEGILIPPNRDVDSVVALDYDLDGDLDIFLSDVHPQGNYYLMANEVAPVYTLYGVAQSVNLTPELNPETQAITRVRLAALDQKVLGSNSAGLAIEYYVSNNGGQSWEFYARFGAAGDHPSTGPIQNFSNLPWHSFAHFGSRLKWKAVITAEEDVIPEYTGGSYETPAIDRIQMEFAVVERREYSRTSTVVTSAEVGGNPLKLVISGTFYFPGWQGHLRAYDVTDMPWVGSSSTELQTVTSPDTTAQGGRSLGEGVTLRWDAGELLNARSSASRNIYTALPGLDGALVRVDFTTQNVEALGLFLNDFQNDDVGLIHFVRGEGRSWKLGDINHSNPVVAGPPDGEPVSLGSGYEQFKNDWANRPKTVIVGANDGKLHCFDVLSGEELWAYIPFNLLPKLRNMRAVDSESGERYFSRDVYVDGTPVVSDVIINGTWRTVLICGQGPGQGNAVGVGATGNYYFALDITDINNPQPLWEFTDAKMGESWSIPAIGKIMKEGIETWTAFMGSGYDNVADSTKQGHRFYAVEIATGSEFWGFDAGPEVNTTATWPNGADIPCAIPGSPAIIDINKDGLADRVYVGDLEGRMWTLNTGIDYQPAAPWTQEILYEDANNYPIITKPAVWLNPASSGTFPRVYFGTGGDDRAPLNAVYSFVAMIDANAPQVEWFVGDAALLGLPADKDAGDLNAGEKVWADPKVANYICYFSTLTGDIETVDPCASLQGIGKLYARFVLSFAGSPLGATAFKNEAGSIEFMTLNAKTRSAVTLGESERVGGQRKKEVYVQEYDSTVQRLEQSIAAFLTVKSWREIYRVIK